MPDPAWSVTINGNTYTEDDLNGNAYADPDTGLPAILRDTVQHVAGIFQASSSTSLTIGGGAKTLSVAPKDRPFTVGGAVRIEAIGAEANFMDAVVTAYSSATDTLSVEVTSAGGAGTYSNWRVRITAGARGGDGPPGPEGPAGGDAWVPKAAPFTAANGDRVLADTSAGPWTMTLPAAPALSHAVRVVDAAGTFATNKLTIARNGQTIQGLAEDLVCDVAGASVALIYTGTTWRLA